MARRIVVVGGGAAGMGAAGGVKAADPRSEVVVYTEFDDVAYSPCGIPYVHGKEIADFERLFLASKQAYVEAGIDIHYNTDVDRRRRWPARWSSVAGEGEVAWDSAGPRHRVQLRRPGRARRRSRRPLLRQEHPRGHGVGQGPRHGQGGRRRRGVAARRGDGHRAGAPRHRDPPGRPAARGRCRRSPTPTSWRRSRSPGASSASTLHFNTTLKAFLGDGRRCARVQTSDGEIPADLAVVCTHKEPNTRAGVAAGLKIGSTGGFVVDERMATSAPGVFAAGDCTEVPHGLTGVPLQGLTGSHAYAQGKTAGINAGGGTPDLPARSTCRGAWRPASGSSAASSFGETHGDGARHPVRRRARRRASPAPATTPA